MAGLTPTELNNAVSTEVARLAWISLHTADPGTTGLNEVVGGAPAYARLQPTWNAPVGGVSNMAAALNFNVPAGVTVAFIGFWTAVTAGTFLAGKGLAVSETYGAQGVFQLTAASLTGTTS